MLPARSCASPNQGVSRAVVSLMHHCRPARRAQLREHLRARILAALEPRIRCCTSARGSEPAGGVRSTPFSIRKASASIQQRQARQASASGLIAIRSFFRLLAIGEVVALQASNNFGRTRAAAADCGSRACARHGMRCANSDEEKQESEIDCGWIFHDSECDDLTR